MIREDLILFPPQADRLPFYLTQCMCGTRQYCCLCNQAMNTC